MVQPNSGKCFHCLETGHWTKDCLLLIAPKNKAEHDERFNRVMERFFNWEITAHDKQRMIAKENELWNPKQKAGARN